MAESIRCKRPKFIPSMEFRFSVGLMNGVGPEWHGIKAIFVDFLSLDSTRKCNGSEMSGSGPEERL